MTKKELLEAIEDMPMDVEIALHYAGASYQLLKEIKIRELRIDGQVKEVVALHGNCKFYTY